MKPISFRLFHPARLARLANALGLSLALAAGSALAVAPGDGPSPDPTGTASATVSNATNTSNIGSKAPPLRLLPARNKPSPSLPQNLGTAPPASGSGMLQVFLSLALVLLLLIAVAFALKRFGPQQIVGGANLRIVGGMSLGGRERVLVLEVGDQWIVIGAAPGRVSALATLPKQTEPNLDTVMGGEKNFATWLKQVMEKRHGA